MPVLSDLSPSNRQKRDLAFSGRATTGDIPYLYALQAEQAAANAPGGIGQGQPGAAEGGAPNPQSFGGAGAGGASGAADTGMPGPGQTGLGQEGDEFFRAFMARQEGGQAGEPGGAGAGGLEYGDPNAFVDPSLAQWTGYLAPFPLSLIGTLGAAGMRGHNAGLVNDMLEGADLEGLSGWQQFGAALGLNDRGGLAEYEGASALTSPATPGGHLAVDALREVQGGGGAAESSSYGREALSSPATPGGHLARGALDRAQRNRGRQDHGNDRGGRGGAGPGGGPGGQSSGSDPGGWRHEGGPIYGEPGEEVGITALAGEHVMSPEAVEMLGPETFDTINMLARIMKGRQRH